MIVKHCVEFSTEWGQMGIRSNVVVPGFTATATTAPQTASRM